MHVMFVVDDIYFFADFDLRAVVSFLRSDSRRFAFHLKLHPNVSYCHPADAEAVRPNLRSVEVSFDYMSELYSCIVMEFDRSEGTFDWCYPWDLCGSVYRRRDVIRMVKALEMRVSFLN